MYAATKEVVWLRRFLTDLGCIQQAPTLLLCDNQAAICLVRNPEFHNSTKHNDVQYHKIREENVRGTIRMDYVNTNNQIADILTKAFPKKRFITFIRLKGMLGLTENSNFEVATDGTPPRVGV